jgi:DNA-binding transcriptional ArsR family regulator
MEEPSLSRALRLDAPDRAAALVDPVRRRILTAFIGRERSLSEAAGALAMPLNRLAYHVGALVRLGLVRVEREQKRAGRPIRFYRAVADHFLVPAAALPRRPGAGLAAELRAALDGADQLAGGNDMVLTIDGGGRPIMTRHGAETAADACEYWRVLTLSLSEAQALAAELGALLRRYGSKPGKGKRTYLAHAALAPRTEG